MDPQLLVFPSGACFLLCPLFFAVKVSFVGNEIKSDLIVMIDVGLFGSCFVMCVDRGKKNRVSWKIQR